VLFSSCILPPLEMERYGIDDKEKSMVLESSSLERMRISWSMPTLFVPLINNIAPVLPHQSYGSCQPVGTESFPTILISGSIAGFTGYETILSKTSEDLFGGIIIVSTVGKDKIIFWK
jgi:hypothetical protein